MTKGTALRVEYAFKQLPRARKEAIVAKPRSFKTIRYNRGDGSTKHPRRRSP
jgi:predicted GIY-YIG superfamily endonuclease